MFGSLDPAKILVILVFALVVLGPERLPRAARQLGAAWRELTRLREQVSDEVRSAIPDMDLPRLPPGSVSGFLRDLTAPSSAESGPQGAGHEAPEVALTEASLNGAQGPPVGGNLGSPGRNGRRRSATRVFVPVPEDPGMN